MPVSFSKRNFGVLSNLMLANADNIYMEAGSTKKAAEVGAPKVTETTRRAESTRKPERVETPRLDNADLQQAGKIVERLYNAGEATVNRAVSKFRSSPRLASSGKKAPEMSKKAVQPKREFPLDEVVTAKSGGRDITFTHVAVHLSESKDEAVIFAFDPTVTHNAQGEECNGQIVVATKDENGFKHQGECFIPEGVYPSRFRVNFGKDHPVGKILGVDSIYPSFE